MNLQTAADSLQAAEQRLAAATDNQELEVAYALASYWRFKVRQYQNGRPSEKGEGDEN